MAEHLGLGDGGEVPSGAVACWPGWVELAPELAVVPGGAGGLRGWLKQAPPDEADVVLLALARLGAADGEDDRCAALLLAWALMPGACRLAGRLRSRSDRIGELVAAQLWVEVRTFPWQRLQRVAGNVLMRARAAVLLECGDTGQVHRYDRTRSLTSLVDHTGPSWNAIVTEASLTGERAAARGAARTRSREDGVRAFAVDEGGRGDRPDARSELLELLDWACRNDVVAEADRRLLLCLVQVAECRPPSRNRDGLLGSDLTEDAGQVLGLGASTVRRRAGQSLRALSAATRTRRTDEGCDGRCDHATAQAQMAARSMAISA